MDDKKFTDAYTDGISGLTEADTSKTESSRGGKKGAQPDFGFFGVPGDANPSPRKSTRQTTRQTTAPTAQADAEQQEQSSKPTNWWTDINDRADDIAADIDYHFYPKYLEPDESTIVPNKKAFIVLGISSTVLVALAICAYFFIQQFPYFTTGVSVKDFINNFNAITSATDIQSILPDYQDIQIPEGTKLGRGPVEIADGYITIDADVRFGKIVTFTATANNLPNYNTESYTFSDTAENQDHFYYYIALGKIINAYNCAKGVAPDLDISKVTVFDAAYTGKIIHDYALYLGQAGVSDGYSCSMDLDDVTLSYTLPAAQLTIEPTIKTLEVYWNTPKAEVTDDPAAAVSETSAIIDEGISSSDPQ